MENARDRRRFTRVEFDTDAELIRGERHHPARLLDVSVKGIMVRLLDPPTPAMKEGDAGELIIRLADDALIHLRVALVHRQDGEHGFRCTSMDLESAANLRRLMELNMVTPDAAEQVLAELLTPQPNAEQ